MRILPIILCLTSNLLLAQQSAKPAVNPATRPQPTPSTACTQPSVDQVQKMMELAGSKKILEGVMETTVREIFEQFKKMRPDIPPQVWDASLAHLERPENLKGLLDAVVPVYQRHFCAEEIEQLIEFYETPTGQKLAAELPTIQKEAGEVGRRYGEGLSKQIAQDVQQELSKRGGKLGNPAEARPPVPLAPALFILSNGEKIESSHYILSANSVQLEEAGVQRTIPLSALNMDATMAANHARGIDLKVPSKGQIMLGF